MQRILVCTNCSIKSNDIEEYFAPIFHMTELEFQEKIIWDTEECKIFRQNPMVHQEIEKLGFSLPNELYYKGSGKHAKFKILEIPDDVDWYIGDNYGGAPCEIVVEKHRSWFPNDINE